jgi:hypothetical protein
MPTAKIQNTNSTPWTAEDMAKVAAVSGVLSVATATNPDDPSLMLVGLSSVNTKVIVRNIAKLFPGIPISWS